MHRAAIHAFRVIVESHRSSLSLSRSVAIIAMLTTSLHCSLMRLEGVVTGKADDGASVMTSAFRLQLAPYVAKRSSAAILAHVQCTFPSSPMYRSHEPYTFAALLKRSPSSPRPRSQNPTPWPLRVSQKS